ncbi:MAG: hypothetical protein IJY36_05370 [Coprobacter sp.]|nr:hypothetical protein [Coprobacter sp.]
MTTSIYVPHFAEGKNYTVKYAEILRPCNVLVTAYTQCADNVMRKHEYSLIYKGNFSTNAFADYIYEGNTSTGLDEWEFKAIGDESPIKIFLKLEKDLPENAEKITNRIYLCADASVVKLIELKTIVPADIVSVNILRLEPLSYIRVEEDEYCLNPHFNSFCFHIALEPGEQSTFIAQSVGGKSVRTSIEAVFQGNPTMNNGLTESVSSDGYERLTISATDERQEFYLMISDIRNLKYFEMPDHVCKSFPLSSVRYCDLLTGLHLKEGATGSSASLQSLRHFDTLVVDNAGIDIDLAHFANTRLKWLDIRVGTNTDNLSFTIDALASYDNKSYLESIFFRGEYAHQLQGITGSLGSLSGFHYLRELVIPYTGITGDIGKLNNTKLERFIVPNCDISGDISILDNCSNLKELVIQNTKINGDIKNFSSTKLERFIAPNCDISGDISILGSCSNLKELVIQNPKINGDIKNFSSTKLERFIVPNCDISGDISILDSCSNLKELVIQNTKIDGDIKNFSSTKLERFIVPNCDISGDISILGNCSNLKELVIQNTKINGDIKNFSSIKLERFIAPNCDITGNISVLCSTTLRELEISNTKISGGLPIYNCTALERFIVSNCNISGNITILKNLSNLRELVVDNTSIGGSLSDTYNPMLEILIASNCNFTGDLSALSSYSNLRELVIDNTSITGDIGNLSNTKISRVIADGCKLSGYLSALPGCCMIFSNENGSDIGFGWLGKTRYLKKDENNQPAKVLILPTPCKIKGTDINNMLYDQSLCNYISSEYDGEIVVYTDDNHAQLSREAVNWIDDLHSAGITYLQIDDEIFIEDGYIMI